MLIGNDFAKAEDKYRRDVLRDQYPREKLSIRRAGLAIVVTVVLVAMLLSACGIPEETAAPVVAPAQSVRDVAPAWEPNGTLMDSILKGYAGSEPIAAAPIVGSEPTSGPR